MIYVSNALAERVKTISKGNTMNDFRQSLPVRTKSTTSVSSRKAPRGSW